MKILIYEDNQYSELYPLNMLRPSFDILCGANSLKNRIELILKDNYEVSLLCRDFIEDATKEFHSFKVNKFSKDDYLLLSGRVIFSAALLNFLLKDKSKNSVYIYKNQPVAAFIQKNLSDKLFSKINSGKDKVLYPEYYTELSLKPVKIDEKFSVHVMRYPWNVIDYILNYGLEDDLNYYLNSGKKFYSVKKDTNTINYKQIYTEEKFNVLPNTVLDAASGKIVISSNVKIEPFTYIKGPVFIGKNVLIKSGTKIYGPCVIGNNSKVAGEIAESVFHGYVNKQHDGFIGHSYICPFVNLGADTVTSDLKNNYSGISIKTLSGEKDTGMMFLGSIIGDHSKTSINTMLNTGSVIGIFANLFGGGFHDKYIKSFSWNETGKPVIKYDEDKAVKTAETVMLRRGIKMSDSYKKLIAYYSSGL